MDHYKISNYLGRYLIYDGLLPPDALSFDDIKIWHFTEETVAATNLPALAAPIQAFQLRYGRTKTIELLGSAKCAERSHEMFRSRRDETEGLYVLRMK